MCPCPFDGVISRPGPSLGQRIVGARRAERIAVDHDEIDCIVAGIRIGDLGALARVAVQAEDVVGPAVGLMPTACQ